MQQTQMEEHLTHLDSLHQVFPPAYLTRLDV